MHNRLALALVTCGAMLTFGCERPFVEVSTPTVTITSPNLSLALLEPTVQLRVRSSSFRDVTRVLVNGADLMQGETGEWVIDLGVGRGLNQWVIQAVDTELATSIDTFYALRADVAYSAFGPRLPVGIGGFAVTEIANDAILVTGGATQVGAAGRTEAYYLSNPSGGWQSLSTSLQWARVGHTASLLPDGRVIVAGGGTRDIVADVGQLVEQVEIIDTENAIVRQVPFAGDPIRRMYHTASVRTTSLGTVLDLYGGVGDINYFSNPRLGTRSDVRSFLFRNDSLIALQTGIGPRLGPPSSGHSQTRTRPVSTFSPGQFLYVGAFFGGSFTDAISFEADYADPRGIITDDVAAPQTLRNGHADVLLSNGLIGVLGGRTDNASGAISSIEVFSEVAGRFFTVPVVSSEPEKRFGHKAIRLANGTILVIGGFRPDGVGTSAAEIFGLGF